MDLVSLCSVLRTSRFLLLGTTLYGSMAAVGIEVANIRSHVRNYSCSGLSNLATQQQRMAAVANIAGWHSCMKRWWLQCNMELDLVFRPHGKMKNAIGKKSPRNAVLTSDYRLIIERRNEQRGGLNNLRKTRYFINCRA